MGKATVLSGGAAGSYTVKIDTGKATQTARLAALDKRLAELVPLVEAAKGYLIVSQTLEQALAATVQACIDAYVVAARALPADPAAVKTALDAYTTAAKKLQEEKARMAQEQLKVDMLLAEQTQATKDRAKWAALVLEETAQAWCADLTEDATGAVATIEIPGENKLVLIAPAAPAPVAADGVLTAREVQSGPQVFWNAAALPGWQKWMPTYRRGTITALNTEADVADVTLDADLSSAGKLAINQTSSLSAVPVQYMTCHARAFEVGDRCVVKFTNHDWAQPKVVGFVDHPKPCDVPDVHLIFWEAPSATDIQAAVAEHQESTVPGGVNRAGILRKPGAYHSVGLVLEKDLAVTGFKLTDTTNEGTPRVTYVIRSFYDGYPILSRSSQQNATTGTPTHYFTTLLWTRKISYRKTILAQGNYTSNNEIYATESGFITSEHIQDAWSSYPDVQNNDAAHQAVINSFGPWAAWNACAYYQVDGTLEETRSGTSVVTDDASVTSWVKQSLPPPKKNTPPKPLVNLELMPDRVNVDTVREYTSSSMAAAPIDRHALDFGYLPYRVNGLKVRSVCKDVVWCWAEGEGSAYPASAVIYVTNYKTGQTVEINQPNFFPTDPVQPLDMPCQLVLADTWAVLAKQDPLEPYFWVWVYSLSMTTGLTLTKRFTNKPGDLGAGFEGVVQVNTPNLSSTCYMVGAMRDETVCM